MSSYVLSAPDKRLLIPALHTSLKWIAVLAVNLMALYLVVILYAQQKTAFALLVLVIVTSASYVFFSKRAYAQRYVYPAVAGMGIFIIFPLMYTVGIGFTNYSASNLLDLERVQNYHLSKTYTSSTARYPFTLYRVDERYRLVLERTADKTYLASEPFVLGAAAAEQRIAMVEGGVSSVAKALTIRETIKLKSGLKAVRLILPDGQQLSLNSLRDFAALEPVYALQADGSLLDGRSGALMTINYEKGFYQAPDGKLLSPGFVVGVGAENFKRVIADESIRAPFLQIFVWTLAFSLGTVLFTLAVGLLLASLLQWERIRGKAFYRTFLILPYAVPAFISILVFKGLFNQNFGEINLVLESLFGLSPDWFSEPTMARTMILIVNTWLGYPYMLLLTMGLLQSIPGDLYEASAMDGAGPLDNFFRITLPLIIKPLTPLLIAAFAFNFNNFVLISLLTSGAPDIIGASTPAGTTDLLVSYTYRIAFQDSGQNFGLAAAIATIIFLLVGGMALLKLRLSKMEV